MDAERLKQSALGCLSVIFCVFVYWGLDNWLGSGRKIKELKQYISSVDSKQFQNTNYNLSRIEKLDGEVKDLKDEVKSLEEKAATSTN
jgi:folate-dependent tRNA-U54 methylase TrmFO/GidA